MKIFEVTKKPIKEAVDPSVMDKVRAMLRILDTGSQETPDNNAGSEASTADELIRDVVEKVLSGEAQLSQDIDTQMAKTDVDARTMSMEIRNLIMAAADSATMQINDQAGTDPMLRNSVQSDVELNLLAAAYGYINKNYNNGSDNVDPNDGPEIVVRAVQSRQPQSEPEPTPEPQAQQPSSGDSSAQPQAQQTTVGSRNRRARRDRDL